MSRGYIERRQPWIDLWIDIPSFVTKSVLFSFLIDTGSTRTLLQPRDTLQTGIEPRALFPDPRTVAVPGFGGSIGLLTTVANVRFDDRSDRPLTVPIGIVEPTAAAWNLPSVLGMDFLQHFRLLISVTEQLVELEAAS